MRATASFQEILEEKMGAPSPESSREIPNSDPRHMAFLLGQIPVYRFAKPAPKFAKPARTEAAASKTSPPPTPLRKKERAHGPAHSLNALETEAFHWFEAQGQKLPGDFLAAELKSAYRRLALKMHPDASNGSAASFVELKTRFTVLESVLSKSGPSSASAA